MYLREISEILVLHLGRTSASTWKGFLTLPISIISYLQTLSMACIRRVHR